MIELRRPSPDDLERLVHFDLRNFGATGDDGDVAEASEVLDLDRFLVGWDGDDLVAAGGSHEMELTVPGGGALKASGVAWVSVAASHRRRGLAARIMAGLDDLAAELDEPALVLLASEAGIYERFGYGAATRTRVIEIDRRRAVIDPRWTPDPVRLVNGQDHLDTLLDLWDRYRRTQVGEVSRSSIQFRAWAMDRDKPAFAALHPDGYALYTVQMRWNNGHPAHRLDVWDLVAVTPEAHLALWNAILSVDLVGSIHSIRAVALDDPLPHLLTDPRAVRTVELNDGLWVKVADPVRCFAARTYRADDRLSIGIVDRIDDLIGGGRPVQTVSIGADGCRPTDDEPELVACRAALGPLLLGATATDLGRARRIRATDAVVERADMLFGTGRLPDCRTSF